ncbi:hypothetical protein [Nocardia sp. NPDC004722]
MAATACRKTPSGLPVPSASAWLNAARAWVPSHLGCSLSFVGVRR